MNDQSPHSTVDPSSSPNLRWALNHFPSHLRLWLVAVLGVVLDLWTKRWAFESLRPTEVRELIPNLCSLQLSLNPGALFGLGAGFAPIFVGASVLALLFVLYLFANTWASRWSMHIALGLVLAGAMGNLYDRATQEAYVAYLPNGGRFIGKLLEESDTHVVLTDFPDGGLAQKRVLPRKDRADSARPDSGRQPVVRDFVKIEARIGGFTLWPWVFNVADVFLVVGVGGLLLNFWRDRKHLSVAEPAAKQAGA